MLIYGANSTRMARVEDWQIAQELVLFTIIQHPLLALGVLTGGAEWGCREPVLVPVLPNPPGGAQHPQHPLATALYVSAYGMGS